MFERVRSSSLKLLFRKYKEIWDENQKNSVILPKDVIKRITDNDNSEASH